jgi:phosphotransferase system enzyme I (PtsI)
MHPGTLLEVRRAIRGLDLVQLRARLPALMRARDRAAIEAWLQRQVPVEP